MTDAPFGGIRASLITVQPSQESPVVALTEAARMSPHLQQAYVAD